VKYPHTGYNLIMLRYVCARSEFLTML